MCIEIVFIFEEGIDLFCVVIKHRTKISRLELQESSYIVLYLLSMWDYLTIAQM